MALGKYREDNERRKEERKEEREQGDNNSYPTTGPDVRTEKYAKTPKIDAHIDHHAAYQEQLKKINTHDEKEVASRQKFLVEQREHFRKREEEEAKRQEATLKQSNEWMHKWREDRERNTVDQSQIQQQHKPVTSSPSSAGSSGTGCILPILGVVAFIAILPFLIHFLTV